MSSPSDDDADSELSKYAPKWSRERPATPDAERPRLVNTASTVPSLREEYPDRRIRSLRPEPVPEPLPRRGDGLLAQIGQMALVAVVAAVVALLAVFGRSLLEGVGPLNSGLQTKQVSEPSDRLTANDAPANRALVPATGIAAAPGAAPTATAQAQPPLSSVQGQQAALSPISKPRREESGSVNSTVRGVTDKEIRFGISAPLTGPAKELGQNMKMGIEAAFSVANANGGVYGRQVRLIAADDGYEPARTAVAMKQLYEKDQIFGSPSRRCAWSCRASRSPHGTP